jgi:lipopolysaccharide/colanic/teichoic acid biosynthesis glycosyltransferase
MSTLSANLPASTDDGPSPAARGSTELRSITLWGMDLRRLHDRLWLSRFVQVVHRGEPFVPQSGAMFFLLVEPGDLLLFNLSKLLKRVAWLDPKLIRLRISDRGKGSYQELVDADDNGDFRSIRRIYRMPVRRVSRPWLTQSKSLAAIWSQAATRLEGKRRLLANVPAEGVVPATCEGSVYDIDEPLQAEGDLLAMLAAWKRPGRVTDSVYEHAEGVWVHETASIDPTARVIRPLWVGAGVTIPAGATICGPGVIPDAPGYMPMVPPVDWDRIRMPEPQLLPSLAGRRAFRVTKRLFDVAFSLAVLIALTPIAPLVMLAIFLEDGLPSFYGHKRQTLFGREFPCWKFRTMVKDAEARKAQLAKKNRVDGPQFKLSDDEDPRILRIGRFLRKTNLDELPQFWNVLVGDMSVVGPRPSPDKENQFCPAWREARLSVRPGVTGLWQVRRTREPMTDFQEWIRYDLEYVRNESWRLDLWIIAETIRTMIFRRGKSA